MPVSLALPSLVNNNIVLNHRRQSVWQREIIDSLPANNFSLVPNPIPNCECPSYHCCTYVDVHTLISLVTEGLTVYGATQPIYSECLACGYTRA